MPDCIDDDNTLKEPLFIQNGHIDRSTGIPACGDSGYQPHTDRNVCAPF